MSKWANEQKINETAVCKWTQGKLANNQFQKVLLPSLCSVHFFEQKFEFLYPLETMQ